MRWKKTAKMLNEQNTLLHQELKEQKALIDDKKAENARLSGMIDALLEELEKTKNECRELAKQAGAALKELELKMSAPAAAGEGRDAQWENMMAYTGRKQEGVE